MAYMTLLLLLGGAVAYFVASFRMFTEYAPELGWTCLAGGLFLTICFVGIILSMIGI